MISLQMQALAAPLILSLSAVLLMLQIAFKRNLPLTALLCASSLLAAALSAGLAFGEAPLAVTVLLRADDYGHLLNAVFCLGAAVTAVVARQRVQQRQVQGEEFYLLLILSTLGACILAYAVHLASLLLGLELLSIALYALIAYPDKAPLPLEGAIKYLVLSAAASATLLFGFALLYGAIGALDFQGMAARLAIPPLDNAVSLQLAAVMIFSGLAFKLSLVPFHLWTPDVYQGAPSPVTGFLASVAKAAVFAVLLRWFVLAELFRYETLMLCLSLVALLSMLLGNLLALLQDNVKRMLAYSSIAHMGYLLIVIAVASNSLDRHFAVEAALYYLIAYTATTLAAFAVLSLLNSGLVSDEELTIRRFEGLFWRQPLLAFLMLVALLSLAGIPLTAGFMAKFYLIAGASSGSQWLLIAGLVIGSAIGVFYYLRLVFAMTLRGEHDEAEATMTAVALPSVAEQCSPAATDIWLTKITVGLLIAAVLLLGVVPESLVHAMSSIRISP